MAKRKRSRPEGPNGPDVVYQLKVTLKDCKPPIWRRLQVRDGSLAELHRIIQVAMGWEDYHLYAFRIGEAEYSDPENVDDLDMEDATRARLGELIPRGEEKLRFTYVYDFGDYWRHEVLVEKVLPPEPGRAYPRCLAGKRAGPPEDVGGVWGYAEVLEALADPKHEQHAHYAEWLGDFDPEAFDPEEVDRELAARLGSRGAPAGRGDRATKAPAKAKAGDAREGPFLGRWRIVSLSQRDEDVLDEGARAFFEIEPDRRGEFQFGDVQGEIDYRVGERDGRPAVEFSWDGIAEMDPVAGRGWAVLDGDALRGMIFLHQGDESEFAAERAEE